MARMSIPNTTEPAKQKPFSAAQIEHALIELGVEYTRGPKEAVTHCIFHNDTGKPNLYVNLQMKPGVYHCFACEVRGSFDEFVRVKTGWTLVKTLQFLIDLRKTISFVEDASKRVAITPQESELDRYAFRHPYCYERGLLEDTLQRWNIGYDKADEALTLPWFDVYGKLVTIKRRSVLTKRYTYPANVDLRGVLFGMQFIKLNSYVWITEGEFDAMYIDQCFRTAHFDNHFAVALGGKTLHDAAFDAICKRQPKQIVLLLDMDSHGRGAVQTIARKIIEYVTVAVPTYSTKDPNELSYAEVVSLTRQIEKD